MEHVSTIILAKVSRHFFCMDMRSLFSSSSIGIPVVDEKNGPLLTEHELPFSTDDIICGVIMRHQVREHVEPTSADRVQTGACVRGTGSFS